MFKRKLSIQINIEGKEEKTIVLPSFMIKNWKKLLASTLSLLVCLFATILNFTKKKTDELAVHYSETLDQIEEKNKLLKLNNIVNTKEITEAKKSFNKIDSTLDVINQKMKKRGLKTIALAHSGGPIETDTEDIELLSTYYEEALDELDRKLENIPLGVPHKGQVTSKFGYRRNPFTNRGREMHSGIDLKGRTGDRIQTTAKGIVTFSGYDGDYGYVVKVQHKNGFETRYAHLSKPLVKKGQRIDAGHTVGLLGSTGRSTGPHLHYEILKNNQKVNPEKYFNL